MIATETFPGPGIWPHVPFADYLKWPLFSNSKFKAGRESMAHLKAELDGERFLVPSDDMILGSAMHVAFLEPELVPTRVALWKGEARRGDEWKAFKEENAGKIILTANAHAKLTGMVRSLRAHPWVRSIIGSIEATELSAIGKIHGVPFKGRLDALAPDMILDLKKVRSGDSRSFTSACMTYGYHTQGFCYRKLFDRDRFVLLTVEDEPPFDVVPYELSPAFLRHGERDAIVILDQYKFAQRTNQWPGRSGDIVQLEVPEWAISDDEASAITIDGISAISKE